MTFVECRCGHEFETAAVCGRTTCPTCKRAVTVPRPGPSYESSSEGYYPEGSDWSAQGGAFVMGLVLLGLGVYILWTWHADRDNAQLGSTPRWVRPAGGTTAVVAGVVLILWAARGLGAGDDDA